MRGSATWLALGQGRPTQRDTVVQNWWHLVGGKDYHLLRNDYVLGMLLEHSIAISLTLSISVLQ